MSLGSLEFLQEMISPQGLGAVQAAISSYGLGPGAGTTQAEELLRLLLQYSRSIPHQEWENTEVFHRPIPIQPVAWGTFFTWRGTRSG